MSKRAAREARCLIKSRANNVMCSGLLALGLPEGSIAYRGILQVLFWGAAAVVVYVYVGYPLLLGALARTRNQNPQDDRHDFPRVTLLISAFNERAVIEAKLVNAMALDYPKESLEIIVVSDCSDDGTDEIVLGHANQGVRLVRLSERCGKSAGLNLGVSRSTGELLVFSDANAMYEPDAIRHLVSHFADTNVGYVVGNARYTQLASKAASSESEGLYWKLETWLKQKESDFGSVVGGDGAIYAIRKELFTPLLPTDINDFLNPLQIISRGYRGVYDARAVCYEEAGDSFEKEFGRKVRIVSRALNAIRRAPAVLLPWTQPRHWFALISHKVLRWFAPVFLIVLLISAFCLWQSSFYRLAALLQAFFYLFAGLGWMLQTRSRCPKLLYLPYYFCLVNLASLFGIFKLLTGSLSPTWQTIRQPAVPSNEDAQLLKRGS
jgi:cellulose synthase/poly-beta-1,6-N-acetylglucosamine synthase-like glycosyltransferase